HQQNDLPLGSLTCDTGHGKIRAGRQAPGFEEG
ncbi:MAG: hypothetical protein JWO94_1962, partial [Verrucomicrobiaceae bacterium]|nr:hypothetical protein [Verrucomicrobiaceae bacterium]